MKPHVENVLLKPQLSVFILANELNLNKKFRYKRSLAWPLTASVVIQPR